MELESIFFRFILIVTSITPPLPVTQFPPESSFSSPESCHHHSSHPPVSSAPPVAAPARRPRTTAAIEIDFRPDDVHAPEWMTTNEPLTFRLIRLLLPARYPRPPLSPARHSPSSPGPLHHQAVLSLHQTDMVPRRLCSCFPSTVTLRSFLTYRPSHYSRSPSGHSSPAASGHYVPDAPVVRHRDTLVVAPFFSGPT